MNNTLRAVLAAGIVYVALFGVPSGINIPVSRPAYSGPLVALHAASSRMEAKDRAGLAAAFSAAADMVRADSRNLLDSTQEANDYLIGILTFDYGGLTKPSQKYPEVADEIEKQFRLVVGDDIAAMDSSAKTKFGNFLAEVSDALR